MIDPFDIGDLAKDSGRRLLETRTALGLTQREFSEAVGVRQTQYTMFETGSRRITIEIAVKLRDHYNLTTDWIYCGDPSGLPYRLWDTIRRNRE